MSRVLSAVAWPYANGPRHLGHVPSMKRSGRVRPLDGEMAPFVVRSTM